MVGCLKIWFGDEGSKRSIPFNGVDLSLVETPPHPLFDYVSNLQL
jgi:hypothetical protein